MADELADKLAFINIAHLIHKSDRFGDLMPKTIALLKTYDLGAPVKHVSNEIANTAPQHFEGLYNFMRSPDFSAAYKNNFPEHMTKSDPEMFQKARALLGKMPVNPVVNARLVEAIKMDMGNFDLVGKDLPHIPKHAEAVRAHLRSFTDAMKRDLFQHNLFGSTTEARPMQMATARPDMGVRAIMPQPTERFTPNSKPRDIRVLVPKGEFKPTASPTAQPAPAKRIILAKSQELKKPGMPEANMPALPGAKPPVTNVKKVKRPVNPAP